MKEMIEAVATVPSLQKYVKQLETFAAAMITKEKEIFKVNSTDFCVNNHGDLWLNNTLWKYNEAGEIEDMLLVDHQEGQICSPGYDLNHFIATSCNLEVQAKHYDELVAYYHEELTSTLKLLGVEVIPSLEQIKAEIRSTSCHGM
jgi:thiamine kinase-like enzyme